MVNTERIFMMNTIKRYLDISGTTMLVGGIIFEISKKNTTMDDSEYFKNMLPIKIICLKCYPRRIKVPGIE